jgi:hypothetical protein
MMTFRRERVRTLVDEIFAELKFRGHGEWLDKLPHDEKLRLKYQLADYLEVRLRELSL